MSRRGLPLTNLEEANDTGEVIVCNTSSANAFLNAIRYQYRAFMTDFYDEKKKKTNTRVGIVIIEEKESL